jgi:hypothetical protein
VGVDLQRLALGLPLAPCVLELTHKLLLLRVDRNDRLRSLLEALDSCVDVLELRVAVGMVRPFLRLAIALKAVAGRVEQTADSSRTQRVSLLGQRLS